MFNYDKLKEAIKASGKSKTYLCKQLDRPPYYLRDVIRQKNNIPEKYQQILAEELGVTVEYLNDQETGNMDIMLERMLSLIPRKPDGKFVHGEKKKFCERIGAPTNIISEWVSGKMKSYRNYLYVVATEYNVSVEWLRGETDEKKPAPIRDELSEELEALIQSYSKASPALRAAALAVLRSGESAAIALDGDGEDK